MANASWKLNEFREQGAFGAYSGAQKVLNLIGSGKSQLVSKYYKEICGYGDWEKARGIHEIISELGRDDLLNNDTEILLQTADAELDDEREVEHEFQDKIEMHLELKQGWYRVIVEMENDDCKYDGYVFDCYGETINSTIFCPSDETFTFEVDELEEGICKVSVESNKGKLKKIKVENF